MSNLINPNVAKATTEQSAEVEVVRVTQLAGDTHTLDYKPDLTVGLYLAQVGIEMKHGEAVTVNGATANLGSIVEANSVIVVAGRVANG